MSPATKNLLFLLSATPMAMGGCIVTLTDDTADSSNDDSTSGDGDEADDEVGDGDGDTTGDGDGDTTGDGDGDGDTTGDGDGDTTGDGDGDTTGDGDGDGDSVCVAYATFYASCYGEREYQANLEYCYYVLEEAAGNYGDACAAAFEDQFACLSTLSCEEFADEELDCEAENEAVGIACAG